MNTHLDLLLRFFARNPKEWDALLPRQDSTVTFVAKETSLISQKPLFCCAYELWFLLDGMALDREVLKEAGLARLRIILQIVFDAGSVNHVSWTLGESDRWDDFWGLVHDLASQGAGQDASPVEFDFEHILQTTQAMRFASVDKLLEHRKSIESSWRVRQG